MAQLQNLAMQFAYDGEEYVPQSSFLEADVGFGPYRMLCEDNRFLRKFSTWPIPNDLFISADVKELERARCCTRLRRS